MDRPAPTLADAAAGPAGSHGLAAALERYREALVQPDDSGRSRLKALLTLARYLIETLGDHEQALTLLEDAKADFAELPEFVRLHARCLWRGDIARKAAAVACLERVVEIDRFRNEAERLEFLCSLMVHKTLWITAQRDELKVRLQDRRISKADYNVDYAEQTRALDRLYAAPGLDLYEKVRNDELRRLGHASKLHCLSALACFMEICLRRKKYGMIDDIFTYVFTRMRLSYHEVFRKKLERINRFRRKDVKTYEDYMALRTEVRRHDAVLVAEEAAEVVERQPEASCGAIL
jgi:hypothetical protein